MCFTLCSFTIALVLAQIPGVVAPGVQWEKVWQEGGNSADGIVPDKDGSVLVAQEDYDEVLKIDETNGQPIKEGPQQTAATIYKVPMLAHGIKGRAK